jgi:hypothetical protein
MVENHSELHCAYWYPALYALLLLALFPPILAGQTLNWKRADSSWSVNYYDVACADSANCAAIGRFAGYRNEVKISDDGGRTWRLVNIDSSGRRILNDFEYQQYLSI